MHQDVTYCAACPGCGALVDFTATHNGVTSRIARVNCDCTEETR